VEAADDDENSEFIHMDLQTGRKLACASGPDLRNAAAVGLSADGATFVCAAYSGTSLTKSFATLAADTQPGVFTGGASEALLSVSPKLGYGLVADASGALVVQVLSSGEEVWRFRHRADELGGAEPHNGEELLQPGSHFCLSDDGQAIALIKPLLNGEMTNLEFRSNWLIANRRALITGAVSSLSLSVDGTIVAIVSKRSSALAKTMQASDHLDIIDLVNRIPTLGRDLVFPDEWRDLPFNPDFDDAWMNVPLTRWITNADAESSGSCDLVVASLLTGEILLHSAHPIDERLPSAVEVIDWIAHCEAVEPQSWRERIGESYYHMMKFESDDQEDRVANAMSQLFWICRSAEDALASLETDPVDLNVDFKSESHGGAKSFAGRYAIGTMRGLGILVRYQPLSIHIEKFWPAPIAQCFALKDDELMLFVGTKSSVLAWDLTTLTVVADWPTSSAVTNIGLTPTDTLLVQVASGGISEIELVNWSATAETDDLGWV